MTERSEANGRSLLGPAVLTLLGGLFVGLGAVIAQAAVGGPLSTLEQRHLTTRVLLAAGISVAIGGALVYAAIDRRYWSG